MRRRLMAKTDQTKQTVFVHSLGMGHLTSIAVASGGVDRVIENFQIAAADGKARRKKGDGA